MKTKNHFLLIIGLALLSACGPSDAKKSEASDTTNIKTEGTPDTADLDTPAIVNADTASIITARTFLHKKYGDDLSKGLIDSASKKFNLSTYDLDNDGQAELFIGLTGPYFCGSGGCTWLLLNKTGVLINLFTVTTYPVYISESENNGWKNLIVHSAGKNHELLFDGKKYPANPSTVAEYKGNTDDLPKVLEEPGGKLWNSF